MASISLMTWNVRYFGHALRGLLTTERGIDRAAHVLGTMLELPDLVALQEVEDTSVRAGLHPVRQLDRFLDRLHAHLDSSGRDIRYEGLYFPANTYRVAGAPNVTTQGLAVLVGPRLVVEHDNAGEPHDITHVRLAWARGLKQRRVVAHVRVRLRDGGAPLDLFNTHLSLPAFFEVGLHQIPRRMGHGSNQLEEISTVLDFVRSRAGDAAVLVGDFNTLPGSPAYQRVIDAGLHDAFAVANDHAIEDLMAQATAGFGTARMHIDHVFASAGVRWDEVAHFPYGDPSHEFHGVSDHTPKIGRLAWV